jgi:hypothetical protein
MAAANSSDSAILVGNAARAQSSQALIVQSYALSALQQSTVDFSAFPNIVSIGTDINAAIGSAKTNSNQYLNVVLPKMITTISNIDAYFNLQNALAQALSPSTPASQAIQLMGAVQRQAQGFQTQSSGLVTDLQGLRTALSTDAGNFSNLVTRLNSAVNGDNGVLASIDGELGSIDSKIDGAITGTVLSGLAIAGGIFLIAIGAIADFVTAGTSTPLVIAGIGIVAAGVGGEVASAITLANLIKLKNKLLTDKAQLKAEVSLALGMKNGLASLADSAANAATASQQMANAWGLLSNDLAALITQLQNGQTTVDAVRLLYQMAAQGTVKNVQGDIQTIRGQLAGTQQVKTAAGQTVDETIVKVAEERKKVA